MCLMAPLRVVTVEPDWCEVESGGRRDRVSTLLADADDLAIGDWVLVTGGTVVRRLDPEQADAMNRAFRIASGTHPQLEYEP